MAILNADRLRAQIPDIYAKRNDQLRDKAVSMVMQSGNGSNYAALEKRLQRIIVDGVKESINHAVKTRRDSIAFSFDLMKAARKALQSNQKAQRIFDAETIYFCFVNIAEESGYNVINGKLVFEASVTPPEPEPAPEPEADEASFTVEAPAAQIPQASQDESEDEGLDDEDLNDEDLDDEDLDDEDLDDEDLDDEGDEDSEPVEVDGLEIGGVYTNGKGIERRIDKIEDGRVHFTVTHSESPKVKAGTSRDLAITTFKKWATGKVDPVA